MNAIPASIPRKVLLLAFSAFLCIINVSANSSGAIKGQGRILEKDAIPFEPIEITDLKVKGQSVNFGLALGDDVNWLQGLTLRIKNTSGKSINFISIQLRVNPPESGSVPKVIEFSAGTMMLSRDGILQPTKVLIAPDESTEITLDANAYNIYKADLESSKVCVRVGKVLFADDTLWSQGMLHTRDLKNPNKWNVVESSLRPNRVRILLPL